MISHERISPEGDMGGMYRGTQGVTRRNLCCLSGLGESKLGTVKFNQARVFGILQMLRINLFLLILVFLPLPATAENLGIKFSEIRVGTEFHYDSIGGGGSWLARYAGMIAGRHVMKKYSVRRGTPEPEPYWVEYYNRDGLLVQREKLRFHQRHTFEPYDCNQSGSKTCTHRRSVADMRTGKLRSSYLKHFEARGSQRNRLVIRNANTNRLKARYHRNELNIITKKRHITKDLNDGYKLIRIVAPSD
ncbi:hypothetical protein [Leisingera sp. ANG-M1]|uniref:hypothetical protein n=1 Tax=Leisingera sp. ANG-M1 TaxID=1577895 RepID=UPI0019D4107E|nr:hypothetical protein [Leisingera sp. ANG-M1]